MPNADPLADLLRKAPLSDAQRADLWDAYQKAATPDDLAASLKPLKIPNPLKADLWDLKSSTAVAPPSTPASAPAAPAHSWVDTAVDWLLAFGGVPGATGGAALGGGAGEAAKQLINRARGVAASATATDAALGIGGQAALQAGTELAGAGIGAGMRAVAPRVMQAAVKPTLKMLGGVMKGEPVPRV